MAESVEQLRIYTSARGLEDRVYELVRALPADQFYGLGNDLRRSSAAVSHYIMEAHRLFSYRLKLDSLAAARREAEATQKHLEAAREFGANDELVDEYVGVIKQSWGLTKWLKGKLEERQVKAEVAAKDERVELATAA
ncbi:MAG TPA: four helix bundle protein [Candidatus Saccharimonadia bacterium]|nr:four helix bundle protein [Candidatus Saccharimonadia bacterium]